jgi:hypothetical protein
MNLAQIRDLALAWLDDEQSGYYTTAQMNSFINMAAKETQKILIQSFENRFVNVIEASTVLNQERYVLPSDFLKINLLEVVSSGTGVNEVTYPLVQAPLSQKDRSYSKTGLPLQYSFINEEIVLRPIPDAVYTLRMYYTFRITRLVNDGDVPEIPEEYHEYIALRAAKFGFIKDGRETGALDVELSRLQEDMKRDAENRNVDRARGVIMTTDDSSGF